MRNLLTTDKQYADGSGDTSHYTEKRQTLEGMLDPRIFQAHALPSKERAAFMNKIRDPDVRKAIIKKTESLEAMGLLK